ncbi:phage/plasmid replication domain-containing protein [Clostridium baratii]
MIHTATLYCTFSLEEINKLIDKYSTDINTFLLNLDSKFDGFSSHIHFKYTYSLYITIDFIEMLKTPYIEDSHYIKCETIINKFLSNLGLSLKDLTLIRIDYRKDIITEDCIERAVLFSCFSKALDTYKLKNKNCTFDTTVYYSNKSIQAIIYDKEQERIDKDCSIKNYEKDVLRFEVRLLNKHLNTNKHKYKIEKTLKNYFSLEKQQDYFKKYILPVVFYEDFYTFEEAEKLINKSLLKEKDKIFLKKFLKTVVRRNLTFCKNNLTTYKYNKALSLLKKLNINPLPITYINPFISKLSNPFSKISIIE